MFAHLGPMLGPSWALGLCWGILGLCWAIVRDVCAKRGFCRHAHPTARSGAGAQLSWPILWRCWPMLAVGLCWPILRAMWAQLGAMLLGAMLAYLEGYVGRSWGLCRPILKSMLAHVDPCGAKRSEKWEQQKNTVKRRIFWGSAMLAHLGAMLAYLEGNVGPSWGYVGPSWAYVGPSWGLCWSILGLCWPISRPKLAHVDPSWAARSENAEKMGRAKSTVKRRVFWRYGVVGGWGGSASLLPRGENRLRQCHGQGAPGRI